MSSAAKIAANRRNAQKSTGPRSAGGKARARRNAFRHGLATPITRDIANAHVIEGLAAQWIARAASPAEREHAQLAAEVQAEILRARQAKVDLLNRALRLHLSEADLSALSEIAAVAFVAGLEEFSRFECYEQRALSRRKRFLRALAAAERANPANRSTNLFFEPVVRLEVTTLVKTALARPPMSPASGPARQEAPATFFDLGSAGHARAEAFIEPHDSARGLLHVYLDEPSNEASEQIFSIHKKAGDVGGENWIAICPATNQPVADLYVRAGERELKSRHALNLHYRSRRGQQRGDTADETASHSRGFADYAAIVAAIFKPAASPSARAQGMPATTPRAPPRTQRESPRRTPETRDPQHQASSAGSAGSKASGIDKP